jgi:hypothetical protein
VKTSHSKAVRLDKQAKAILEQYVSLLDSVPGPVSVWATVDEGLLHFYTLIADDRETERELYCAEAALIRANDPVPVDFDVHVKPGTLRDFLFAGVPPFFHRD